MNRSSDSSPDPLLRFRPEFPILEKTTYLISNSLGAMPRAAGRALAEYAETWGARGVRAWADSWWDMSVDVGDRIAPPLGAPAGSVSMLPNVTIASAVVLSCLDYAPPRNRIVMIEGEFPSVRYVYESLATRLGAEVVVVPSPGGDGLSADEGRILEVIDERTALVAEKSLRQTSRLIALAQERGWRSSTPRDPARRGGTAAVDFESALEVSRELNARDVVVDYRPGVGIRMSPHFYTEDRELDRAFEAIDEIRSAGAWRRWQGSPSLVT